MAEEVQQLSNAETDWSEEELREAVRAYLEMARRQRAGLPFAKNAVYRDLAERFGRSNKSFEYRMQNISHVLDEQGKDWLPGLRPATNVGRHGPVIARLLAEEEGALPPLPVPISYLVYWREEELDAALEERKLDHAASNQFAGIKPGDVIWVCGSRAAGELVTIGSIVVYELLDRASAEAKYRRPMSDWRYHVFARPGYGVFPIEVSLTPILSELRFASEKSPQLDTSRTLPQQFEASRVFRRSPGLSQAASA